MHCFDNIEIVCKGSQFKTLTSMISREAFNLKLSGKLCTLADNKFDEPLPRKIVLKNKHFKCFTLDPTPMSLKTRLM